MLAEPMAAAGQPLACGEPPSSEAAALRAQLAEQQAMWLGWRLDRLRVPQHKG